MYNNVEIIACLGIPMAAIQTAKKILKACSRANKQTF